MQKIHSIVLVLFLLLLGSTLVACNSPDPNLTVVSRILNDSTKSGFYIDDPSWPNVLYQVKDKSVIPLLLDYLRQMKASKTGYYLSALGTTIGYLRKVTGIESHTHHDIAGTRYYTDEEWETDLQRWQTWWETNQDRIEWDYQAGALKVR